MSYTKGPWTHIPEDNWINDFSGRRICTPHSNSQGISIEERDANANLIAAAPCMLKVLEGMKINLEIHKSEHRWAFALLQDVDAVLKKAKGEI